MIGWPRMGEIPGARVPHRIPAVKIPGALGGRLQDQTDRAGPAPEDRSSAGAGQTDPGARASAKMI